MPSETGFFSLDEIWRRLTTSGIGFYTFRTRKRIPATPGIYAWFMPLRVTSTPGSLLELARRIFTYDPRAKGQALARSYAFQWDPLHVSVARDYRIPQSSSRERYWSKIQAGGDEIVSSFQRTLMSASIFARPLYVGLTNDLSRRYSEHTEGRGEGNSFHTRYYEYKKQLEEEGVHVNLTIERMIFACIPVPDDLSAVKSFTDEQIRLSEDMLKLICQPVFGER